MKYALLATEHPRIYKNDKPFYKLYDENLIWIKAIEIEDLYKYKDVKVIDDPKVFLSLFFCLGMRKDANLSAMESIYGEGLLNDRRYLDLIERRKYRNILNISKAARR